MNDLELLVPSNVQAVSKEPAVSSPWTLGSPGAANRAPSEKSHGANADPMGIGPLFPARAPPASWAPSTGTALVLRGSLMGDGAIYVGQLDHERHSEADPAVIDGRGAHPTHMPFCHLRAQARDCQITLSSMMAMVPGSGLFDCSLGSSDRANRSGYTKASDSGHGVRVWNLLLPMSGLLTYDAHLEPVQTHAAASSSPSDLAQVSMERERGVVCLRHEVKFDVSTLELRISYGALVLVSTILSQQLEMLDAVRRAQDGELPDDLPPYMHTACSSSGGNVADGSGAEAAATVDGGARPYAGHVATALILGSTLDVQAVLDGVRLVLVNEAMVEPAHLQRALRPAVNFEIPRIKAQAGLRGFDPSVCQRHDATELQDRAVLTASVCVLMRADYFNSPLVHWEPLVEPWQLEILTRVHLPALLRLEPRVVYSAPPTPPFAIPSPTRVVANGASDMDATSRTSSLQRLASRPEAATAKSSFAVEDKSAITVEVRAAERLDVNFSEAFLETACGALDAAQRDALMNTALQHSAAVVESSAGGGLRTGNAGRGLSPRSHMYSSHRIRNDSGARLWYALGSEPEREVVPGREEVLQLPSNGVSGLRDVASPAASYANLPPTWAVRIRLELPIAAGTAVNGAPLGSGPRTAVYVLNKVPFDRVGVRVYPLPFDGVSPCAVDDVLDATGGRVAVCEVESRGGVKLLRVRSALVLENNTGLALHAVVFSDGPESPSRAERRGESHRVWETVMQPHSYHPVPLSAVPPHKHGVLEGTVRVRPHGLATAVAVSASEQFDACEPSDVISAAPAPTLVGASATAVRATFCQEADFEYSAVDIRLPDSVSPVPSRQTSARPLEFKHARKSQVEFCTLAMREDPVHFFGDSHDRGLTADAQHPSLAKGLPHERTPRGHLSVLSFSAPLLVRNLLAVAIQYELKCCTPLRLWQQDNPHLLVPSDKGRTRLHGGGRVGYVVRCTKRGVLARGEALLWHECASTDVIEMRLRLIDPSDGYAGSDDGNQIVNERPGGQSGGLGGTGRGGGVGDERRGLSTFDWSDILVIPTGPEASTKHDDEHRQQGIGVGAVGDQQHDGRNGHLRLEDSNGGILDVCADVDFDDFTDPSPGPLAGRNVHLYVPYWICNSSGLPLEYQHDPIYLDPKGLNSVHNLLAGQVTGSSDDPNPISNSQKDLGGGSRIVRPGSGLASLSPSSPPVDSAMLGRGYDGSPGGDNDQQRAGRLLLKSKRTFKGLRDIVPSALLTPAAKKSQRKTGRRSAPRSSTCSDPQLTGNATHQVPSTSSRDGLVTDDVESGGIWEQDAESFSHEELWLDDLDESLLMVGWTSRPRSEDGALSRGTNRSAGSARKGCGRLRVRVSEGSRWSESLRLDTLGTASEVEMRSAATKRWAHPPRRPRHQGTEWGRRSYALGMAVSVAPPPFHRTKIVTMAPRFVIVNALGRAAELQQAGDGLPRVQPGRAPSVPGEASGLPASESGEDSGSAQYRSSGYGDPLQQLTAMASGGTMMLDVNDQRSFHWPDERGDRALRVRLREYGSEWSGKWRPGELGETVLRLRNVHTRAVCFLRVEISVSGPTVFAVLRLEPGPSFLHPPFRLENLTLETLQIRQSGACREGHESSAPFDGTDVLLPYRTAPYTWDEPTEEQFLIVELVPSTDDPRYRFDTLQHARGSVLSRRNLPKRSSSAPAPVLVGVYSLDRLGDLGLGRGSTATRDGRTSHIRVHMFTDGPTKVLQLTDARNVPARGPSSLDQLRGTLAAFKSGTLATSMGGASDPKQRSELRAAREGNGDGHDASPGTTDAMVSATTELAILGEDADKSQQLGTLAHALIQRSVGAFSPLSRHSIALTHTTYTGDH